MKRVLSAAFVLLYAAFTVLAIAEHTASWASTFSADSKSQTTQMRANSPRSSQVRIEEDPFVVFRTLAKFALADAGISGLQEVSGCLICDSIPSVPSRAPPTLL